MCVCVCVCGHNVVIATAESIIIDDGRFGGTLYA